MLTLEFPGLGEKKYRNLLQKMDSIIKIARARNPELSSILEPNPCRWTSSGDNNNQTSTISHTLLLNIVTKW